jgi:RHS repeat-associated protein
MQDTSAPEPVNLEGLGTGLNVNFIRNRKFFELANHLGNVLATVSDSKRGVTVDDNVVKYYEADMASAEDYYPFGMLEPARSWNAGNYRYGFNGKENDNEIKGEGSQQDYGLRIYDTRIGRFLSQDPLAPDFPWNSPYAFAEDKPTWGIDLDGAELWMLSSTGTITTTSSTIGGATAWAARIAPIAEEGLANWAVEGGSSGGSGITWWLSPTSPWVVPYQPQLKTTTKDLVKETPGPQKSPQPESNPQRQYNPHERPTKEDNGDDGYYIYETAGSQKSEREIVPKSKSKLPYFGITKQAMIGSPGRYGKDHERAKNVKSTTGIIGKTDGTTALGVEAALIALNTYGKDFELRVITFQLSTTDVKKSTRIDNLRFQTKNPLTIAAGISWLESNFGKDWKDKFLRTENKKGKKHPDNDKNKPRK